MTGNKKNLNDYDDIRGLKNNTRNQKIYDRHRQKKKGKKFRENIEAVTSKYQTITPVSFSDTQMSIHSCLNF